VALYNGHPDHHADEYDLDIDRAVVVGNGNVAIDVARMLVLAPEELAVTDTADHAIDALNASKLSEVQILGRRGPAQAAFTNPELLELGELSQADVIIDPADLEGVEVPEDAHGTTKKNVTIMREFAQRKPAGKPQRVVLRFFYSPVEVLGDGKVEALKVVRNEIVDGVRWQRTSSRRSPAASWSVRSATRAWRSTASRSTPPVASSPTTVAGHRRRAAVRRRLGQARSLGGHRDEQEVRPGHDVEAARGRRGWAVWRTAPPWVPRRLRRSYANGCRTW